MRASELFFLVFDDLYFYTFVYLSLLGLYLMFYKKFYWGLFDPMLYSVLNMVGGAFCVWLLSYQNSLKPIYGTSFVYTEIALLGGFAIAHLIPVIKIKRNFDIKNLPDDIYISEIDVLTFVISISYLVLEAISVATVGIILLDDESTHVSAFEDHGILRAFVASFRMLMMAILFYRKIVLHKSWSPLNLFCLAVLAFGTLTSGSKSSILSFAFLYFIMSYPMIASGRTKKLKLSLPVIIALASFPVIVMMVKIGTDASGAAQQVYVRLLSSGDIFLLGYNESVLNSLTETSFFKYAFYPGFGTILKNLGFAITPPRLIGSDIFEFYTNRLAGGGPNARHNYMALHFFGPYMAAVYSLIVGLLVGYVRNVFKQLDAYNISAFGYLFFVILTYYMSTLIDDINVFGNYTFWTLFFLIVSFIASKFLYMVLRAVVLSRQVRQAS